MIFACLIKCATSKCRNAMFIYNLWAEFLRHTIFLSYLFNKNEGQAINLKMTALVNASFYRFSTEYL